jgi:hypothetical protein
MSALHHAQSDEPGPGHTLPLLHQLVYCSRAADGVGDSAVERIIATARRMNPEQGITGLLVFGSGVFFQWIEGPRDNVTQLMQRIQRDPRHERVVTLSQSEEVRERLFPDWSMELVTPDHIRDVLQDALATAEDEKNTESLRLMLEHLDATGLGQLMGDA